MNYHAPFSAKIVYKIKKKDYMKYETASDKSRAYSSLMTVPLPEDFYYHYYVTFTTSKVTFTIIKLRVSGYHRQHFMVRLIWQIDSLVNEMLILQVRTSQGLCAFPSSVFCKTNELTIITATLELVTCKTCK